MYVEEPSWALKMDMESTIESIKTTALISQSSRWILVFLGMSSLFLTDDDNTILLAHKPEK